MTKQTKKWRVTYVDLMAAWSSLLTVLYFCLSCLIGIKAFVEDGCDSLLLWLVASFLMVGIMWIPGLLMTLFLDECYPRLALTNSAYQDQQRLFTGGIRQIWRRFREMDGTSYPNIAFICGIVGLATLTAGMTIMGIVLNSEPAITFALYAGMVLSWGGALVIAPRLIYDFLRGRHRVRWLS